MNQYKTITLNLLLRSLSIIGKFFLIVFIAKNMSLSELGIYSIFFTTVTLCMYFLGYDFHNYVTREILSPDCTNQILMIRDQFVLHLFTYLIFFPLVYLISLFNIFPQDYIFLFCSILICDHLALEFFRLYIILSKSLFANLIFFIRSSFWIFILFIIISIGSYNLTIKHILIMWNIGAFAAVVSSMLYIKVLKLGKINKPINWKWVKKGFVISTPFFISTIAYKIIDFSNRYFIDGLLTKSDVGIFTFFHSISSTVHILVFSGIIMLIYPKMIAAYGVNNTEYNFYSKQLKYYAIFASIALSLLTAIFLPYLLKLIGKDDFTEHIHLLWILLCSINVYLFSLFSHYSLYLKKMDNALMFISIIGAIINILLNIVLIKYYELTGAAMSLLISYLLIFVLKYFYDNKN